MAEVCCGFQKKLIIAGKPRSSRWVWATLAIVENYTLLMALATGS